MIAKGSLWFVNATQDYSALALVCRQAQAAGQVVHVFHRGRDRAAILKSVLPGRELVRLIEVGDGQPDFTAGGLEDDAEFVFLPCVGQIDWADLQRRPLLDRPHCLQLLFAPPFEIQAWHYLTSPVGWLGWRARGNLARRILREPSAWQANGVALIEAIQHWPDPPRWQSIPWQTEEGETTPRSSPPVLTMSSRVLAVISYFRGEEWLHACLTCMNQQTRPPENIVVVDDCSPALPLKLLEPFPNVTLLSTARNVGPEKILNNIIRATDYEAYLVQDPDDWSAHDRLELSLRAAERTGAGMVGSSEFRLDLPREMIELCAYPIDVNYAMAQGIHHHLLHGTSLISRELAVRVGGFDEQLKLCADIDFVARAWHAGRIVNLPNFCFFRRVRAGSLTTAAATGYQSKARNIEDKFTTIRGKRNLALAQAGQTPGVVVKQKEPVAFTYHQGPKLRLCAELTAIAGP